MPKLHYNIVTARDFGNEKSCRVIIVKYFIISISRDEFVTTKALVKALSWDDNLEI